MRKPNFNRLNKTKYNNAVRGEYVKHSRNSRVGKRGYNKRVRLAEKEALREEV